MPRKCGSSKMEYTLIRSRRRTLALTVCGGRVTVRAPYGMPEEEVRRFVEQKRRWVETKIAEQYTAAARYAAVRQGICLLDSGTERPVYYGASKNMEEGGSFFLKNNKAVRSYFEKTRCWILYETVHSLSYKIGLTPHDVSLCDFKARWGSCDAEGRVKLNWRLAMLPPELRDYVIIHELCHLRELNHSAVFWRLVEKYCPSYREYRSRLRDFSFLTLMYRREKTQS